ncbi:FG-GAP-like repeat-containing protein [Streptomyces sp. NPDC051211]|uniref:FG-GAP-like repeat-containing protein n=1 Tax=Streptomyces sp. NPDC051211 TaxID=3154643 RepID=UPI00344E1A38
MPRERKRWGTGAAGGLALLAGLLSGGATPVVAAEEPVRVRTITYNACAVSTCRNTVDTADQWAEKFRARAASEAGPADVIAFQELCDGQYEALKQKLVGYVPVRAADSLADNRCTARWGGTNGFGQALFVKGEAPFTAYSAVVNGADAGASEKRRVLCAKGPVGGRTTLACGTHLEKTLAEYGNWTPEVMRNIAAWAADDPVILTGDFNAVPSNSALDPVERGLCGAGPFAEADRAGNRTAWGAEGRYQNKFDHAFFGSRDFKVIGAKVADIDLTPVEDHKLLWAEAEPVDRTPAAVSGGFDGDRCPDLLAIRKDGQLRSYPGAYGGAFGPSTTLGGDWTDALVSHRGDWTGDGHEDAVARIGDGLRVYPGDGKGGLGAPLAMGNRPENWGTTTPVSVGDLDKDGNPDIVAVGASGGLYLHRGAAGPQPALPHPAVQLAATGWKGLTLIAPGDVNGDGRADLWAMGPGGLTQYLATADGKLDAGSVLDAGLTLPAGEHAVSVGDGDLDGRPDLWTTQAGDLVFRAATGTGFAAPVKVGTGGWGYVHDLG